MVSGTVAKDTLQLNEDTFWGQSPNRNHNANAKGVLSQVQQLIFQGKYEEAQKLAIPNWMSTASSGTNLGSVVMTVLPCALCGSSSSVRCLS